jgi:hypothetical protein
MEGNFKKGFQVQGKQKLSSQIWKFIAKQSGKVMYPEFETLDYNYQRSESGEHK